MKTGKIRLIARAVATASSAMLLTGAITAGAVLQVSSPRTPEISSPRGNAQEPGVPAETPRQDKPDIAFSPALYDILKLVNAKVSDDIIKAYIETYPYAYEPSADQIIALKDRGVSSDVIKAVVQHKPLPKTRAAQPGAQAQSQPAPYVPAQPAQTAYTLPYAPPVTVPTYYYPPSYNYWWYGYSYPRWGASYTYWPSYYSYWPSYCGYRPYWGYYGHRYYHGAHPTPYHGHSGYAGRYPGHGAYLPAHSGGQHGYRPPAGGYQGGRAHGYTTQPYAPVRPAPTFTGASHSGPRGGMPSGIGGGGRPAMSAGFSGGPRVSGMSHAAGAGGGFRGGGRR